MAHGFKTGGRKKGSLNKVTSEMKAAIAASGETPLEYMLRIMRDEAADPQGETIWLKRRRPSAPKALKRRAHRRHRGVP